MGSGSGCARLGHGEAVEDSFIALARAGDVEDMLLLARDLPELSDIRGAASTPSRRRSASSSEANSPINEIAESGTESGTCNARLFADHLQLG
jgi:hypothetical protein